jgi:hypothetical protein
MKNNQKGFVVPLIIAIVALLVVGGGYVYYSSNDIKTTPLTPISTTTSPIVGGDKDEHGCIGSAGYSWCAVKNKCLRVWEEKCEATSTQNVSTATATITTEKASGIIKSAYTNSDKNYIDIDYIEFNTNWAPGGMSGPAYQNDNPKIRTLEISSNAKFMAGNPANKSVSFSDFKKVFSAGGGYEKLNPWDIIITNGLVTQITEHYLP